MVLGKLPVPGRPTILITVGQGPIVLAVGAGGVVLTFLLSSILSPLSPCLWETARYRLKYCLKGPLNPKQPNSPFVHRKVVPHLLRLQQGRVTISPLPHTISPFKSPYHGKAETDIS